MSSLKNSMGMTSSGATSPASDFGMEMPLLVSAVFSKIRGSSIVKPIAASGFISWKAPP